MPGNGNDERVDFKGKYVVLSVTTLAQFMAAIDATIVFLAVPSMGRYFHTNASYMTILVVAYIISTTSLLLPSGAIGQRFGRKFPFLIGFAIFAISSLGIALSPGILWAIVLRAIEGSGAALMLTLGIPILLKAFPPEERGKAVGISSTSWSIGALLGPIVGGYLVTFAWQYIFLINVPIGIIAMVMGFYRIPKEEGLSTVKINKMNVAGFLAFLVPLVIGIAFISIYWIVASLVLLPVFLLTQRGHPLIPVELFSNRKYYPIILSAALQGIGFMGILYVLSVFFQSDLGLSSIEAGLAVSAFPAASILGTPLGGYLLDKTGRGGSLMFLSMALQGVAIFMMVFFIRDLHTMIIPLLIAGFGGSVFWSVSTTLSVDVAGDRFRNMASGTLFTVRNGALIVGIALLPVFISFFSSSGASGTLLIFGTGVSILEPVRAYIIFLAAISLVSSAILAATRKRWDVPGEKVSSAKENPSES
ncbi:MAG TPA: MFS transporter [Thermoplasmataceae archaeon]|nr:MFS transporter [Thermoplasmataceae archaeon]